MEHRFSLSIHSPRLSNPIADSTWIDGPPTINRSTMLQLSPKQRSNSSICLSGGYGNETSQNNVLNQTSRTSTTISKMTRQKLNLSHIDPKTYADVHSSGLASRIVKYHQEGNAGLQRSRSFNNLHPLVTQPRRTSIVASPLSHKPNLPLLSMTQIAPPERSFYCGNTLPSLMRSSSSVGVEKFSEQLSRENRPILHPQSLQHENEPTRSVLEELKEISRKRINSDDIPQSESNIKKSCNRMTDFVDHPSIHHSQQQQQQLSMLQQPGGFKRQRELSVAVPLRLHYAPVAVPLQHHQKQLLQQQQQHQQHQQQQQQHQHQTSYAGSNSPQQSPEQMAKRRNCSYSNDITSSLSSSKLHSNKRKLIDMREKLRLESEKASTAVSASGSSNSPDNSPRQHAAKIQRRQPTSDLRLEHLTKSQSTPITPLPATPAQRTVSAPTLDHSSTVQEDASAKPKLTLFNAQQQSKKQERALDLDSPDVDAGEFAGIQFVKPKLQNSFTGVKNSNMERTQKTKLALMLSSLRGEIFLDETELTDEPDAKLQPTVVATVPTVAVATTTPAVAAAGTTTTTATTTAVAAAATLATKPSILSVTTIAPGTTASTAIPAATITTPKAATGNALPLISFNTPVATTTTTTNISANASVNVPVLAGFKLPSSTTNTSQTTVTTATTAASATMPAVTATVPAFSMDKLPVAATVTATTAPLLAFANTAATTSTTSLVSASTSAATTTATIAPRFSFGNAASTAQVSTAAATTATSTVSAAKPMFAFGSATAETTVKPISVAANTNKAFSFGNTTSNINATPTPTADTTSAQPAFKMDNWTPKPLDLGAGSNMSFNSAFKPTTAATGTAAATPASNIAPAAGAGKLFSFGTVTSTAAPTITPAATPIFGQAAAPAAATAMPTPTPSFSFNTPATAVTTATAAANNSTNLFTFAASGGAAGAVAKPVAKAAPFSLPSTNNNLFNFGAGDKGGGAPKTATTAANSFSFNAPAAAAPAAANNNNFSFNATPKQTSIFGGSNSNTTATATPNANAAATKPFAFGGMGAATEQQPPAGGGVQTPRAGGFSFAAVAQKNESTNLFSSPAAKPSFNFGGNSAPSTAATVTPAGPTTQAPAAFGGFATPATAASKPFTFGGGPTSAQASNVSSPIGGNLFANAVSAAHQQQQPQQQPQQPKPSGFFSTPTNAGQPAAPANANTPFAFGSSASPAQVNNAAKPFAFGAGSNNAGPPSNIFGNSAPAAAPSHGGPFNFGGSASPAPDMQASAQQMNNGNLFALPNTPESRPIRRATRRLQKQN